MQEATGCRYRHRQAQSYNVYYNYIFITTYVISVMLNLREIISHLRLLALLSF